MLTKVIRSSSSFGTQNIVDYYKTNLNAYIIQDNLNGKILVKTNKGKIYLYDYNKKKCYSHNKIQIQWNDKPIIKHLDSFDQNNLLIANKLRDYVLKECLQNTSNNYILGIGGEYYIYFPYIKSKYYYGMSNHNSIVLDAKTNVPYSHNWLVNYDKIQMQFNNIFDIIILNVYNIHEKIIKWIIQHKFVKLIIISCDLSDSKLKLLSDNFKIKKIKYFKNVTSWIRIITCYPKKINL